jgi:hypothetical protein
MYVTWNIIISMIDESYKNEKYTQKLGFTYEIPNDCTKNVELHFTHLMTNKSLIGETHACNYIKVLSLNYIVRVWVLHATFNNMSVIFVTLLI